MKCNLPRLDDQLYNASTVRELFSEMSKTYGKVNLISSFGFSARWRKQCVRLAAIEPGQTVYDLMTGMGECLPYIIARAGKSSDIRGVDFCAEMCQGARSTASQFRTEQPISILEEDVLETSLPPNSADRIVCSFGLKTLDPVDIERLAALVFSLLKPGGQFSFVEISEPKSRLLRATYLPYIRHLVPLIGLVFLGNPNNYRQLGIYTQSFKNCGRAHEAFTNAGLETRAYSLFFSCATGLQGRRPTQSDELDQRT